MIMSELRFLADTKNRLEVKEEKELLRTRMKERRSQNVNRDVKETLLIENFFQAISRLTTGAGMQRTYFVYLSFSSEAPTDKLIERLLAEGEIVYCPRLERGEMVSVLYGEDFTLSKLGIREPVGKSSQEEPSVIVLPLLAVDEKGNRLGYGGGYYDRYLRKYPKVKRIAYCYDFQVLQSVPVSKWDEQVDVIVTDKRIIETERTETETK